MNQIEDIFQNQEKIEKTNNEISTNICVQEAMKTGKSIILGLLETGATGIFIERAALKNVRPRQMQICPLSSKKEISSLTIKLPDFCNNKTTDIQAYIKGEAVGRHDIIKGTRVIQ